MNGERGAVLVVSTFLLVLLMILGLSVASGSRVTLLGASASAARQVALQQALGAQEGFVERQRQARENSLLLTNNGLQTQVDTLYAAKHSVGFIGEAPCKRTTLADSGGNFVCRTNQVSSQVAYGRGKLGSLSVTTGIEQQVLLVGN